MDGKNLEGLVRAVAEGTLLGVLAGAEVDGAVGFSRIRYRGEGGTLVGAIAEWLGLRMAAGAPVVGLAGFNEDRERRLLRDMRSGHTPIIVFRAA
jgi:hypothetical protein